MFSTLVLFAVLILASASDIRHRTIPNYLTYSGLVLAFMVAVHADWTEIREHIFDTIGSGGLISERVEITRELSLAKIEIPPPSAANTAQACAGCLAITIPLLLLFNFGGIGGGDVKLGACIGAFTGMNTGLSILFFGHCLAGAFALLCIFRTKQVLASSTGIPMAVFYLLGTLFVTSGVWV